MRRKHLQHYANTLCHIFCGWQLFNDWGVLTRCREGTIVIDALKGTGAHNGQSLDSLAMADILHSWLREDLAKNNIPIEELHEAALVVEFRTEETDRQRDKSKVFADPKPPFITCELICRSRISTDEKTYVSKYEDHEEWPKRMAV